MFLKLVEGGKEDSFSRNHGLLEDGQFQNYSFLFPSICPVYKNGNGIWSVSLRNMKTRETEWSKRWEREREWEQHDMDTKKHKHFHTIPPKNIKYEHLLMFEDEVGGQNPALVRMVQIMLAHIDLSKIMAFTEHCCIIQSRQVCSWQFLLEMFCVSCSQVNGLHQWGTTGWQAPRWEKWSRLRWWNEEEGKYGWWKKSCTSW